MNPFPALNLFHSHCVSQRWPRIIVQHRGEKRVRERESTGRKVKHISVVERTSVLYVLGWLARLRKGRI